MTTRRLLSVNQLLYCRTSRSRSRRGLGSADGQNHKGAAEGGMGGGGNSGEEEDASFFSRLWTRVVSIATLGRRHVQARSLSCYIAHARNGMTLARGVYEYSSCAMDFFGPPFLLEMALDELTSAPTSLPLCHSPLD